MSNPFLYTESGPFAESGDRAPIPPATQPNGSLSYAQGFGPDYEEEQGVAPEAKDIPRQQFNQVLRDDTHFNQCVQEEGVLPWRNDQNYVANQALVKRSNELYFASLNTGPTSGGAVDPGAEGQAAWKPLVQGGASAPFIDGMNATNSSVDAANDITVSAGACSFSTTRSSSLLSAITKRADAVFAPGNNAGGMAQGRTLVPLTTYNVFAISNAAGAVEVGFDITSGAEALLAGAAGFTSYKWLSSFTTDAAGAIIGFQHSGDNYSFTGSPPLDVSLSSHPNSYVNRNVSTPPGVPVLARFSGAVQRIGTARTGVYVTIPGAAQPPATVITSSGLWTLYVTFTPSDGEDFSQFSVMVGNTPRITTFSPNAPSSVFISLLGYSVNRASV